MPKKILMTGATGLIGSHLTKALIERGDEVTIFSRSPRAAQMEISGAKDYIKWIPEDYKSWKKSVNGQDAIIHLAGTPVMAKRWTGSYKAEILKSRKISTGAIVKAISEAIEKPQVLISASAIGYYGSVEDGLFNESSPSGSDFLATVCKLWEQEASGVENFGVRRVSIRLGIVLAREGGALKQMITPYRLFIGGPLGNGHQGFPWIHIDDVLRIFLNAIDDESIKGAINAVAPDLITMNEFAQILGKVMKRPSWFRVPGIVLNVIVGEGAETIIKTPKIIPEFLQQHNFNFKYKNAESALKEILGNL